MGATRPEPTNDGHVGPGSASTGWTDDDQAAFAAHAHDLVAANAYLTLSTADASGRPWVNPVYFSPHGESRFLWVSSPTARHSMNIAARPEVAIVIFDSTVPIGGAEALYASARAGLVPDAEIDGAAAVFNERLIARSGTTVDGLGDPGPLRLYQATVTERSVLLRGGDPRNTGGIDTRVDVPLPPIA